MHRRLHFSHGGSGYCRPNHEKLFTPSKNCDIVAQTLLLPVHYCSDQCIPSSSQICAHSSLTLPVRTRIARQLIIESPDAPTPTPRGRKCVNPPRRLQGSHVASFNVPEPGAKRKRPPRDCAACNPPKSSRDGFKREQSIYRCADCDVTLCFPRCFDIYHSHSDYKRALRNEPDAAGDN